MPWWCSAHPTVYKSMPLLRELVRGGMVDGIEIDHPSNSPEDKAECAALCGQYHLIHTGGTDFHGANHKRSTRGHLHHPR